MRNRLWTAVAALAVLAPAAAFALEVGVQATYWYPSFDADVAVDDSGGQGTEFNVKDDMDVSNEGIPGVRAFFGLGDHHLSLAYLHVKYDGSDVQADPIEFGGIVINPGDYVDFTLEYDMIDAEYRWDLIDLENVLAGFSLGPVLGAKLFDGSVEMDVAGGDSEKKDFSAIIPLIGASAHIGILSDVLEARATVKGMGISGNRLVDALAEVSWTPFPFVDVGVGYRAILLDVDYDDVSLEVKQAGPYAGLTVSY